MKLENILDIQNLNKEPQELQTICKNLFRNGKYLRAQLVSLIGESIDLNPEKIKILSRIIEYIHSSSLLHDDFIDQSEFRRQSKTAWAEFSPSQAVLAGDYLLAQVNLYLYQENNLDLLKITAEAIVSLARGEFFQRELIGSYLKDIEKLNKVNQFKTSCLFQWCLKAPFIMKQIQNEDLYKNLDSIGYYLGLLFQRSDDLMDFGLGVENSKPVFSDLKQGYYNSFSYYLMKEADMSLEKKYQACTSLEEIKNLLPHFDKTLEEFHKDNEKIIQTVQQDIDQLKNFLTGNEVKMIDGLKKYSQFFYWRKEI